MTNAAFAGDEAQIRGLPTELKGSHKRAAPRNRNGQPRNLAGQDWQNDTRKFREFTDLLFSREEDKAQFTALYAITKWQDA